MLKRTVYRLLITCEQLNMSLPRKERTTAVPTVVLCVFYFITAADNNDVKITNIQLFMQYSLLTPVVLPCRHVCREGWQCRQPNHALKVIIPPYGSMGVFSLLYVCLFVFFCLLFCLFPCTLTDFSAAEKDRGVKFCMLVRPTSGQIFSLLVNFESRRRHCFRDVRGH